MPEFSVPPTLLALFASFLFGAGILFAQQAIRYVPPYMAAWLSIGITFSCLLALSPFLIRWEQLLTPWLFLFCLTGLAQPYASISLAFASTQKLGPTIAGTVASTAPLFAAVLAMIVLGERPTLPVATGTLGIVAGAIVLSWTGRVKRGWPLLALIYPVGTALFRGIGHTAQKFGLEHVAHPLIAALTTYGAAFLCGLILRSGRLPTVRGYLRGPGLVWMGLAGANNAVAILAFLTALRRGTVVVVAPIGASFPMFTLLFVWIFFQGEGLTRRTVLGVLLIVPSVMLISLFR